MAKLPSVVVLTGAGLSAESGIETFRAAGGLWETHRVEDVASPEGFARDPALVHRFYNDRRHQLLHGGVAPHAGHVALAKFQKLWSGNFLLVTQNVDNLHEQAGSEEVVHMHGELLKMRCARCGLVSNITSDIDASQVCGRCGSFSTLRPNIVWFGEMPFEMDVIYSALASCNIFIAIGTSGNVYPAAGFVDAAIDVGADTVELNIEPSSVGSVFAQRFYGPASIEVPRFFEGLLSNYEH